MEQSSMSSVEPWGQADQWVITLIHITNILIINTSLCLALRMKQTPAPDVPQRRVFRAAGLAPGDQRVTDAKAVLRADKLASKAITQTWSESTAGPVCIPLRIFTTLKRWPPPLPQE